MTMTFKSVPCRDLPHRWIHPCAYSYILNKSGKKTSSNSYRMEGKQDLIKHKLMFSNYQILFIYLSKYCSAIQLVCMLEKDEGAMTKGVSLGPNMATS
jgi:hypothetical protein